MQLYILLKPLLSEISVVSKADISPPVGILRCGNKFILLYYLDNFGYCWQLHLSELYLHFW